MKKGLGVDGGLRGVVHHAFGSLIKNKIAPFYHFSIKKFAYVE